MEHRASQWKSFIGKRGRRYENCRIENFQCKTDTQRKAVQVVQHYVTNISEHREAGTNLVILGPSGTGKDHLATAVIRAAIGADFNVVWTTGQDLFNRLRSSINGGNVQHDLEDYVRVPIYNRDVDLLAISDPIVAGKPLSDFETCSLYSILDKRYSKVMPTLVTVNVASRSELDEAIGVQVADRLLDGAIVVGCNWDSFRKPSKRD